MAGTDDQAPTRLVRRLTTADAVLLGLGSMLGAGVFTAIAPAAEAAGSGLLLGLAIAAAVAYANATSSAQLAALHPTSGGTYAYGRARLGPAWGYLAGWAFVVGKTASCAAMALTVGTYLAPDAARPLALAAVVAMTVVNHRGVRKTVTLTRVLLAVVLASLVLVVVAGLGGGTASADHLTEGLGDEGLGGTLRAAGFLFFAFAGYARIATLGEEVVDPARTIPRAIPRALGLALVVYAAVAVAALAAVGPEGLAGAAAPLVAVVEAGDLDRFAPAVQVGAGVAALGVLLSLLAGVGRTAFAMAADGGLPRRLAHVHPVHRVPDHAGLAVGAVVAVLVAVADLRHAIGFSSVCVLTYYAVTNAAAWVLPAEERRWPRSLSAAGGLGCAVLAISLPATDVLAGGLVLATGVGVHAWRSSRPPTASEP